MSRVEDLPDQPPQARTCPGHAASQPAARLGLGATSAQRQRAGSPLPETAVSCCAFKHSAGQSAQSQPSPSIFQILINEILHQSLRYKNGSYETGLSGQGVWGGGYTQLSHPPSPTLRPKETPPDSQAPSKSARVNGCAVKKKRRRNAHN